MKLSALLVSTLVVSVVAQVTTATSVSARKLRGNGEEERRLGEENVIPQNWIPPYSGTRRLESERNLGIPADYIPPMPQR